MKKSLKDLFIGIFALTIWLNSFVEFFQEFMNTNANSIFQFCVLRELSKLSIYFVVGFWLIAKTLGLETGNLKDLLFKVEGQE